MKRRKIVGLILLIGTLVYVLASILAFYRNQRVKMEKGIEEALKAYSDQENLEVKELSKDFNLLLDEKLDVDDMNQQILKYEGSFARIDKNVTNVTDELAVVEYNINNLNEKMEQIENFYNTLYEEFVNKNTSYEEKITEINSTITNIKGDVEKIENRISEMEKIIAQNDSKQDENVKLLQEQIAACEKRLENLEGNVLYYQYDNESQTLNMYGNQEGEQNNE